MFISVCFTDLGLRLPSAFPCTHTIFSERLARQRNTNPDSCFAGGNIFAAHHMMIIVFNHWLSFG